MISGISSNVYYPQAQTVGQSTNVREVEGENRPPPPPPREGGESGMSGGPSYSSVRAEGAIGAAMMGQGGTGEAGAGMRPPPAPPGEDGGNEVGSSGVQTIEEAALELLLEEDEDELSSTTIDTDEETDTMSDILSIITGS